MIQVGMKVKALFYEDEEVCSEDVFRRLTCLLAGIRSWDPLGDERRRSVLWFTFTVNEINVYEISDGVGGAVPITKLSICRFPPCFHRVWEPASTASHVLWSSWWYSLGYQCGGYWNYSSQYRKSRERGKKPVYLVYHRDELRWFFSVSP